MSDGTKRLVGRVVLALLLAAVLVFAVQGGEYSTTDLVRQALRKKRLRVHNDSVALEVDSLARLRRAIVTDPAVQERIAREEFGMVRGAKEILYRFAEPVKADSR